MKLFTKHNSLGRKQEMADSLGGNKYDGQSLQEAKIRGLVYTLCLISRENKQVEQANVGRSIAFSYID